jgi:2'-5' RNA ligase
LTDIKFNNLFFALWPDLDVRLELVRLQQEMCGHNGRLHHPQDLHMTLVFLGRVAPDQLTCIKRVADTVTPTQFALKLTRTGYWKRPRILWCSPDQTPEQLSQLVADLQQGLTSCGFQPEKRDYRPHVTLARKAKQTDSCALDSSVIWRPKEFVLAGSHSGPELPRYNILKRWRI